MHLTQPLRIPPDGYVILPISMSRSNNSQSASLCYDLLEDLHHKCADPSSIDVIVLYTTSLYYNDQNEPAWNLKRRLVSQMLSHKAALNKLIRQRGGLQFGIHFLPWEEIVLSAPDYQQFYQKLHRRVKTDRSMHDVAVYSIGNREVNDASVSFLLEETAVTHLLRQKRVKLPKKHVTTDTFRLVVYPGPYIAVDLYQWKHAILPQRDGQPYGSAQYNAVTGELYDFSAMPLPGGDEWQRELRLSAPS